MKKRKFLALLLAVLIFCMGLTAALPAIAEEPPQTEEPPAPDTPSEPSTPSDPGGNSGSDQGGNNALT